MKYKVFNKFLKFITFGFAYGITLAPFGIYFKVDDLNKVSDKTKNHENIHWKQQMEMLILPFYIWYVTEWLIRILTIFISGDMNCYRNLSFEREAYSNEYDFNYLKTRKPYSWLKYIFNKNPK